MAIAGFVVNSQWLQQYSNASLLAIYYMCGGLCLDI